MSGTPTRIPPPSPTSVARSIPYGAWEEDATYGTVWVPSPSAVGADFTPYVTAGHWAYDDRYTWVSDYSWGWAPFHYGRWVSVGGVGWEWIPGRAYAGAWVSWRYGSGDWAYVGWAPLAPTWCWRGGYPAGVGYAPRAPYAYVGSGDLFSPSVGTRVIAGPQAGVIGAHTVASPTVNGPSPSTLRIPASTIASGSVSLANNRGVALARAFSHANSAVGMGAHAPQAVAPRVAAASFAGNRAAVRVPAYAPPAPSHFGGRLGGGFSGSGVVNAPGYGRPHFASPPRGVPSYAGASRPTFSAPAMTPRLGGSVSGYRAPAAGGGARYVPSAPTGGGHTSGGYSGGGFHTGGFSGGGTLGGGGGGFHGGGGGSHGGGGRR